MTARIKGPSEAELSAMIAEAKRAVNGLKGDLRTALLDGRPTSAIRDGITDARSRIRGWERLLEDAAAEKQKVIASRVASLRFSIAAAATAGISDRLSALQPPPFPVAETQGIPA